MSTSIRICVAYLAANDPDHAAAYELADVLADLSEFGEHCCYVSILTLEEVMWTVSGILSDQKHGVGEWRQITGRKKRRAFVEMTGELAAIIEGFLSESWLSPLPIDESTYTMLPTVMRGHDLRPVDICHLALARAAGCGIVTNDRDFHGLEDAPVEIVTY